MIRSIRGRLLVLAAVWLGAALLAAFLFISALLEDFVTDRFDAEAAALADGLIASIEVEDGRIELCGRVKRTAWPCPMSANCAP